MKTNLFKVFFKKEKIFWNRTLNIKNEKISWFQFLIALIFLTIQHYIVAIAHFIFEVVLWIFNRALFKLNLQKLQNISVQTN